MATTQIKNGFHGGTDDQLLVNPDGSINVNTTGGGGGNASVGPTGSPVPADGTLIAGEDPSGNLVPIAVDSNGHVIISGTAGGFDTLSPGYPTQRTVGTTSVTIIPSNVNRKYAHVSNNSGEVIFIQFQVSAALNQGVKIWPGGFYTLEETNLWRGDINAIGLMAGQLIDVLEGI